MIYFNMAKNKEFLENAAKNEYKKYTNKGLELRAKPFFAKKLPSLSKKLLVVGMALGGNEEVEALKKYFPKYQRYGIDIAKSALDKNIDANLKQSDLANLKFKSNYFSGIMCSAVMHEVFSYSSNGFKKVEKSISESSRCLVPGGILAIREFFVPDEKLCKVKLLTNEAKIFSEKFIKKFRKIYDKNLTKQFKICGNYIFANKRLLYELMLHFRVAKTCSSSFESFFKTKEIEEQYLPLSLTDYFLYCQKHNLEIIKIEYIDFKKYYPIIEKNFKIYDQNNKAINNKFGFVDIICQKK